MLATAYTVRVTVTVINPVEQVQGTRRIREGTRERKKNQTLSNRLDEAAIEPSI